ncbi:MAG: hypothetical protein ACJ77K_02285 [Bacteroidia bacterium]
MDVQAIKRKIMANEMSDDELLGLVSPAIHHRGKGSFLKTILKGFVDAYTAPNMWRVMLQAILIFVVIIGTVLLSYWGRIDATVTSVLLAFVLGFLFGKFK